jgi:dihydroorotate dehydrogenase
MKCLLPPLGLAGGIDRDGSRAAELLAAGFGSVEFGTVTPDAQPGCRSSVALLTQRLAALGPRLPAAQDRTLIGIGIGLGLGQGAELTALGAHWLAGLQTAWPVADYLSFNLSAAANRPLLAPEHARLLTRALTLKLPLEGPSLSTATQMALAAGFDAVIAVLPQRPERLDWLHAWAQNIDGAAQLVAVGGIRSNADVRAALDAGASGIQVHRVFAEQGSACLPPLLAGLTPVDRGRGDRIS